VEPLLWLVAALLVALGIAGTVLPALPGAPMVFVGLVMAAAADRFERVGWPTLLVLALLTLVAMAIDLAAGTLGARRIGASPWAIAGAALGTIAGLFFGFAGLLLGPLLGAVGGEWLARREMARAARVGLATFVALLLAAAGKIALVFLMLGLFALAWWI